MTTTTQPTYYAYMASDMVNFGQTCDGRPFIAETYFVVAENANGRRYRHAARFPGAERYLVDGEPRFADLREPAIYAATLLAERVNAALTAGQKLDRQYWDEVDPAYGSAEYVSQGIEKQRWSTERMEALGY